MSPRTDSQLPASRPGPVRVGAAVAGVLFVPVVLTGCVSLGEPVYGQDGPPQYGPDEIPHLEAMLEEAQDNMLAQDSVRISIAGEAGDYPPEFVNDGMWEEADTVEMVLAGTPDVSAVEVAVRLDEDEVMTLRSVDGETYLSSAGVLTALEASVEQDPALRSEDVDFELMEQELDDRWLADSSAAPYTDWPDVGEILDSVEENADEELSEVAGELELSGDGYFYSYSAEGVDVTFSADEEPKLSGADYDEGQVELGGWNEEEVPEVPSEVVSEWEFEEIVIRSLGGYSGDGFGEDFGDPGGDPWDEEDSVPAGY